MELKEGKVDLVNKVSEGDVINAGELAAEEDFEAISYPRSAVASAIAAERDFKLCHPSPGACIHA